MPACAKPTRRITYSTWSTKSATPTVSALPPGLRKLGTAVMFTIPPQSRSASSMRSSTLRGTSQSARTQEWVASTGVLESINGVASGLKNTG